MRTVLAAALFAAACSGAPVDDADGDTKEWVPAFAQEAASTTSDPALDVMYRDCLVAAGFDPEGVQVVVGSSGAPLHVKTGHNVPATFHGPCFEAIGGAPTTASSWGVAIADG